MPVCELLNAIAIANQISFIASVYHGLHHVNPQYTLFECQCVNASVCTMPIPIGTSLNASV